MLPSFTLPPPTAHIRSAFSEINPETLKGGRTAVSCSITLNIREATDDAQYGGNMAGLTRQ
jgi:hypothetical protein